MKLLEAIEKIADPRMEGKVKHKLSSIIDLFGNKRMQI